MWKRGGQGQTPAEQCSSLTASSPERWNSLRIPPNLRRIRPSRCSRPPYAPLTFRAGRYPPPCHWHSGSYRSSDRREGCNLQWCRSPYSARLSDFLGWDLEDSGYLEGLEARRVPEVREPRPAQPDQPALRIPTSHCLRRPRARGSVQAETRIGHASSPWHTSVPYQRQPQLTDRCTAGFTFPRPGCAFCRWPAGFPRP